MIEQIQQLLQQQRWEEAEAQCRAFLLDHPTNAKLHAFLGLVLFRQSRFAEAVDSFKKSVILDPNAWEVHLKLAQSLDRLQRYAEALTAARDGFKLQPNDPHLRLLIQGLEPLVKERTDGWERTVNITYHHVELHGPSDKPKPAKKEEETEEQSHFYLKPRTAELH